MPIRFGTVEGAAGPVGVLTLDAPDRLNAFGRDEFAGLGDVVARAADSGITRLVVRGTGRGFSAGADLAYLRELAAMPAGQRAAELRVEFTSIASLVRFPGPTVALAHGPVFGMATCVALACDRVVTTPTAKWGFVFTALGLPGTDALCHWLLARRIGTRRAWPVLAEAATLSGEDALARGIVDELADPLPTPADLTWAADANSALAATKAHLLRREGAYADLDAEIDRVLPEIVDAVGSAYFARRLAALGA